MFSCGFFYDILLAVILFFPIFVCEKDKLLARTLRPKQQNDSVMDKKLNPNIIKSVVMDYLGIVVGCFIVSVAFVCFISPYKFVPGGVFGASIVLHNLFPQLQVGTFVLMLSCPLLVLSYFLLGKNLGAKTLFATLIVPIMMNTVSMWVFPTAEALQTLSPQALCGGMLNLENDRILAVLLGATLVGIGEGFIMRAKATSGGSDIIAMLLHKYLRFKFSNALLATDATIVFSGIAILGLGIGSVKPEPQAFLLAGYSLVCIFIMSRMVAFVLSGSKSNKLMFVVSDTDNVKLRDFILYKLDRTATSLRASGLYSQEEKCALMMVVHMREVETFTTAIKAIAPDAFVIVTDAYDAYGTRWKPFPEKNTLDIS